MKKYIEKLHFISSDDSKYSHIEQVQLVCEAGAKWIQYRSLNKSKKDLLTEINAIAEICDDWGATLIVTNHVDLKGQADIQGFHLEDPSVDLIALREKIGEEYTLGGSATNVDDLIRLAAAGADYASFGAFANPSTKPDNTDQIGIEGYINAMKILKEQQIVLPVLAVGDIQLSDVAELMSLDIFGIAVSSGILQSEDPIGSYKDFYYAVV